MPVNHISLGTNGESDGIFDYYKRSVADTASLGGSRMAPGKSV